MQVIEKNFIYVKKKSEKMMVKNGPFGQNYIVASHSGTQYFLWASLVCLHA